MGLPGGGDTSERWLALYDLAVADVAMARLCEAHLDAVAILGEAGLAPRPGALYGVWASARPDRADAALVDRRLDGPKSFCSGIGIVDRALIDAGGDGGRQLVDADVRLVPTRDGWRSPEASSAASTATIEWHHRGLLRCNTGTVQLVAVDDVTPVGPVGWYLERVGFWHGACGPAACWAGGSSGLLGVVDAGDDPFRLAAVGELAAHAWTMRAVLRQAGHEIDRWPDDVVSARRRAFMVRHAVHELASAVLDRFRRAWGPRPLVSTREIADRVADVEIYLRQYHDLRDVATLGAELDGEMP